jgi:formylmethanofuran dehydrogenase subunit E
MALPLDTPAPETMAALLERTARRHRHLCPRQVLGVRIGLAGAAWLGLDAPREDKRLLVIAETDGCFVTGLEEAAGVHVGRRTLRVNDVGRIAATFADITDERAVRIAPSPSVRTQAFDHAPEGETRRWHAMLAGYQTMPGADLMTFQAVRLEPSAKALHGKAHRRVTCTRCGEEVINQREVASADGPLCRCCAGEAYYGPLP